jgi:hypothetical protein
MENREHLQTKFRKKRDKVQDAVLENGMNHIAFSTEWGSVLFSEQCDQQYKRGRTVCSDHSAYSMKWVMWKQRDR